MNFLEEYILSYFAVHDQYSFLDISKQMGLSIEDLDDIVSHLIENNYLIFDEDHMLVLTDAGIEEIGNIKQGYFRTSQEIESCMIKPEKAWSLDKIYVPNRFRSKW